MTALISNKILLTRQDLPRLGLNLSNSTMLRLEAAGQFPKRVRIGAHSVAWLASEIHEHIAKLADDREAGR
jgi:prophage regulatory protein